MPVAGYERREGDELASVFIHTSPISLELPGRTQRAANIDRRSPRAWSTALARATSPRDTPRPVLAHLVVIIYTYTTTEFGWDEAKNRANIRKHGIALETAKRIFNGPVLTWSDRRKDYGEQRQLGIGRLDHEAVIVVAWTNRAGRIRLISARPASRKERSAYHGRLR